MQTRAHAMQFLQLSCGAKNKRGTCSTSGSSPWDGTLTALPYIWTISIPAYHTHGVVRPCACGRSCLQTLNVLNLALHQNVTRLRANLLLLLINCLAFTTDLLIAFGLTPVTRAANGRL